jgi:uncharacterized membrane protein required for colicin V production
MYDRGSLLFLFVFGLFGAFISYLMLNHVLHIIGGFVGGLLGIGAGVVIMWLDEKSNY